MDWLFELWDAVELWLVQLWYPLQVTLVLAVLLSELIGEVIERAQRGRRRPMREFRNGDFVRKEHE